MKIGIFQDIHANLLALEKAIEVCRAHQCTKIYHVGDLIGFGPYPKETFDLAHTINEMEFIMGNHDYWFAFGLTADMIDGSPKDQIEHYKWTYQQVGESNKSIVKKWAFTKEIKSDYGKNIVFQHYGIEPKSNWFKDFVQKPNNTDLDKLFKELDADMIFYGHNHIASDIQGNSRYVNLGSAGSFNKPAVRVGILDLSQEELVLEKLSVHYDDTALLKEFDKKQVPARELFKRAFMNKIGY